MCPTLAMRNLENIEKIIQDMDGWVVEQNEIFQTSSRRTNTQDPWSEQNFAASATDEERVDPDYIRMGILDNMSQVQNRLMALFMTHPSVARVFREMLQWGYDQQMLHLHREQEGYDMITNKALIHLQWQERSNELLDHIYLQRVELTNLQLYTVSIS